MIKAEIGESAFDAPETIELHYPMSYVLETWSFFRLHGVLPRAGGYDDQDYKLMLDWSAISRRYAQLRARLTGKSEAEQAQHWERLCDG